MAEQLRNAIDHLEDACLLQQISKVNGAGCKNVLANDLDIGFVLKIRQGDGFHRARTLTSGSAKRIYYYRITRQHTSIDCDVEEQQENIDGRA